MPGVVLLDRAILLAQEHVGAAGRGWKVRQVKFLHPCGPGDVLNFLLSGDGGPSLQFSVYRDEVEVASGSLQAPTP